MLVFAGLVKKCLQYGHSFRLAGVWLKCKNLHFACVVDRFCSSRAKKNTLDIFDFQSSQSYQADIHSSIFSFFSTLQCQSAFVNAAATDCNKATLWRHVQLQAQVYLFLVHLLVFLVEHGHWSPCFEVFPCTMHLLSTSNIGSMVKSGNMFRNGREVLVKDVNTPPPPPW